MDYLRLSCFQLGLKLVHLFDKVLKLLWIDVALLFLVILDVSICVPETLLLLFSFFLQTLNLLALVHDHHL